MRPYAPKIAILAIIVALVALIVVANSATTGSSAASQSLPDEVDRLIPVSDGTILRQETIGIDVADGYTASLIVNGVAITNPIQYREGTEELVQDGLVINAETGLYTYTPVSYTHLDVYKRQGRHRRRDSWG